MIKNPSYSGKVRIAEESNPGSKSTKNPHGVANVNQPQGPRTGNAGAHEAKRGRFVAEKQARAPLADTIARAYGARAQEDYVTNKLEPISADSKRKFKK